MKRLLPIGFPTCLTLVLLLALPTSVSAAGIEVQLRLPQRAKLDLRGRDSLTALPFLVVLQEGSDRQATRDVDVQKEFERYLLKVLRRETRLDIIESGPIDYPSFDLDALTEDAEFWREVGDKTQSDLILVGSLDFDVQDRSGYRTEETVSPYDGRTYTRQVLVEQTGFEYDILMLVFDGETGEAVYRDNFKDFQSFEGGEADPLVGMFENLYSLEDKIVGIFTQKSIETTRILLSP